MTSEILRRDLKFNLEEWSEEDQSFDFVIDKEVISSVLANNSDSLPNLLGDCTGHLELTLLPKRLVIKGHFEIPVQADCDRCLDSSQFTIKEKINEVVDLFEKGDPQVDEDSDYIPIKEGHIDLIPFMGEMFWLAWPFQILCSKDCQGLCSGCAANLNKETCRCDKLT